MSRQTERTDWSKVHEQVVETFAGGWADPHVHAWDDLLSEDVELTQPLLADATGLDSYHDEVRRLLTLAPDVRGDVLTWAGRSDVVFIELRITGTAGRARVDFRTFDKLHITRSAVVVRREAFFDPLPVAKALLTHPSSWLPWWHSGIGPLTGRRRFLRR
ncbi:SnoaL-like domain-containing protein [Haloechinothrix alba]|uniref:SnoaL-like domain-containing protein n=1 Tax=Haloechinothrix alba TaxID=664784 RepID=A0A238Z6M9_9PSEU|nr:nuclear transport factor 2 family protein [Haloechinothrix alba]SNR78792.1 SnoaL-like domain-containing protein [Haloechinothrix alba]